MAYAWPASLTSATRSGSEVMSISTGSSTAGQLSLHAPSSGLTGSGHCGFEHSRIAAVAFCQPPPARRAARTGRRAPAARALQRSPVVESARASYRPALASVLGEQDAPAPDPAVDRFLACLEAQS